MTTSTGGWVSRKCEKAVSTLLRKKLVPSPSEPTTWQTMNKYEEKSSICGLLDFVHGNLNETVEPCHETLDLDVSVPAQVCVHV